MKFKSIKNGLLKSADIINQTIKVNPDLLTEFEVLIAAHNEFFQAFLDKEIQESHTVHRK